MRELKQNTAITVLLGQLFDWADSKTLLSDALGGNDNFDAADIVVTIFKGTTSTELTLTKSGGSNDINLVAGGMASLELTTGNTDTLGLLTITIENATAGSEVVFPASFEFAVVSANYYDAKYGSGNLEVILTSDYDAAKTAAQPDDITDAQAAINSHTDMVATSIVAQVKPAIQAGRVN